MGIAHAQRLLTDLALEAGDKTPDLRVIVRDNSILGYDDGPSQWPIFNAAIQAANGDVGAIVTLRAMFGLPPLA